MVIRRTWCDLVARTVAVVHKRKQAPLSRMADHVFSGGACKTTFDSFQVLECVLKLSTTSQMV